MVALTWILSIVSVLGVVGTIAAVIFFPAVAIPLLQAIVARILACKPCLYVIAVVGLCFASWWLGHHQAVLDCRAGELTAQLRNQKIDLENANRAAADEANRAINIEVTADEQRKKDAAYIATLEARPACNLDDSDLGIGRLPGRRKSGPGVTKPSATTR